MMGCSVESIMRNARTLQKAVKSRKVKTIKNKNCKKKYKKSANSATASVCQFRSPARKKGRAAVKSEKSRNCETPW
jgi:hypothetical protein